MRKTLFTSFFRIVFIFYAVFVLFFSLLPFADDNFIKGSDLVSFLTGAKIVSNGEINFLYDVDTQFSYQKEITGLEHKNFLLPFRNPPIVAYLYLPFVYFPLKTAFFLVFLLNILLLYLSFYFLKAAEDKLDWKDILTLSVFWPVASSLHLGQATPFTLLVFVLTYFSMKKQKYFISGLVLGLLFIKPQLMMFLPFAYLMAVNKKEFVKGVFFSTALFVVLNLFVGGLPLIEKYLEFLNLTESVDFGSRYYHMFSFYPLQQILFGTSQIKNSLFMFMNLLFYTVSIYLFSKVQKSWSFELKFSLGILIFLIFLPHLLVHDLILYILPIAFLLVEKKGTFGYSGLKYLLYFGPLTILLNMSWVYGLVLFCLGLSVLFFYYAFKKTVNS